MDRALKRFPAFDDNDKIWFGKYNNERLEDVPASYLLWWFGENVDKYRLLRWTEALLGTRTEKDIKLFNYIWNSKEALEMETKVDNNE